MTEGDPAKNSENEHPQPTAEDSDSVAKPGSDGQDRQSQVDHFSTDHLLDDLKGRSVRGGAVTLAAQAIKFILQMGSTMVLARLLTPADFGLIAMVTAVTGFVAMFKDAGLSMATVQREHITHEQVSTLFWVNVALSILVMIVVAALAPAIAWFYGKPELTWITLALASTFIFGGLTVQHQALLRRQMRFKALSIIEIASMAAGVATAITMSLLGFGYWSLVGMPAAGAIVGCILVWLFSGWHPGKPTRSSGVRPMLKFGGNLTGFNFVSYFSRNTDNILIGYVWGSEAVGGYSKAYSMLLMPIKQLDAVFSAVAIPSLSRLETDPPRYIRAVQKYIAVSNLLIVPPLVVAVVYSSELVAVLLGSQWVGVGFVFRILSIVAIIQVVARFTGWILISQGQSSRLLRWGMISSPVAIASFVIGIPWGPSGVASSYAIANIVVLGPLSVFWATRKGHVALSDVMCPVLLPLGSALVVAATLGLVWQPIMLDVPLAASLMSALIIAFGLTFISYAFVSHGRDGLRTMFCAARDMALPLRNLIP